MKSAAIYANDADGYTVETGHVIAGGLTAYDTCWFTTYDEAEHFLRNHLLGAPPAQVGVDAARTTSVANPSQFHVYPPAGADLAYEYVVAAVDADGNEVSPFSLAVPDQSTSDDLAAVWALAPPAEAAGQKPTADRDAIWAAVEASSGAP